MIRWSILEWLNEGHEQTGRTPWRAGMTALEVAPPVDEGTTLVCWINGVHTEDLATQLSDGDVVAYTRRPGGPLALLPWYVYYPLLFAISYVAGRVLYGLFGPDKPKGFGDQSSAVYSFAGMRNVSGNGVAAQIVYGEVRVPPLTIGAYTSEVQTDTGFASYLRLLMFVSEGPIEGLGIIASGTDEAQGVSSEFGWTGAVLDSIGLQINNLQAGDLSSVTAWVRRGNIDQPVIPGFAETVVQYGVEQTIGGPSGGTFPSTPGVYASGAEPSWPHAIVYSMGETADEAELRINFPSGQYKFDSQGNLDPNPVQFQVRYRRLVGGVGTGDWIVLPPFDVQVAQTSNFYWPFPFTFSTTAGYAPPLAAPFSLALDGVNDSATKATPNKIPNVQGVDVRMSAMAYTAITTNLATAFTPFVHPVISHINALKGFTLSIVETAPGSGSIPGGSLTYTLRVTLGDGTATTVYNSPQLPLTETNTHVGFTYEAGDILLNNPLGLGTLRMFWAGAKVAEFKIPKTFRPLWASGGTLRVGSDGTSFLSGKIDECSLWSTVVAPAVFGDLAQGVDLYGNNVGYVDATSEGLISLWHFDGNGNDATTTTPNNLTLNNGATANVSSGIITKPEVVVPLNAAYRIEVIRCDTPSTSVNSADAAYWESIKLITWQPFSHPGDALISLLIIGSDEVSGSVPLITVLTRGRKVLIWDGVSTESPTFTTAWTANPAWIALDLALDEEFGLGSDIKLANIDLDAFGEWADHNDYRVHDGYPAATVNAALGYAVGVLTVPCDQSTIGVNLKVGREIALANTGAADWNFDPGESAVITAMVEVGTTVTITATWPAAKAAPVSAAPVVGDVQGREARCRFDGVIEGGGESAWTQIQRVFKAGRAVPYLRGNTLTVFVNMRRDPVDLIGMGGTGESSFSVAISSTLDRINALDVEFLDRDRNFERVTERVDDELLTDSTSYESVRVGERRWIGIVRRSQMRRDALLELASYRLRERTIRVARPLSAYALTLGQVVLVSHDVPQWGYSGRIREDASSVLSVKLDTEVTLGAGTNLITVKSGSTNAISTATVSTAAGTYAAGTAITMAGPGLAFSPAEGDEFLVGESSVRERLSAQVTRLEFAPGGGVTVTLLEYSDAVFDADDALEDQPVILSATQTPPAARSQVPNHVLSMNAVEENFRAADGDIQPGVRITWQHDPETSALVAGARVFGQGAGDRVPVLLANVMGSTSEIRVAAERAWTRGRAVRLFVVPYGKDGRGRRIQGAQRRRLVFDGLAHEPTAPTAFALNLRGARAIHTWTPSQEYGVRWVEVRVGGWILGQRVFREESARRESGPIEAWTSGPTNSIGQTAPRLFAASVLSNGMSSVVAEITTAVSVSGAAAASPSVAVEDSWGSGTLTDLQIDGAFAPPRLKFLGAALTGSFQSADYDLGSSKVVRVQAFVEVEQVHPTTIASLPYMLGSIEMQRWTLEGPRWLKNAEVECSAQLEIAYSQAAAPGTSWQRYAPGEIYCRSFALRWVVTRPASTYDVSVKRFGIEATVVPGLGGGTGSAEGFAKHYNLGGM